MDRLAIIHTTLNDKLLFRSMNGYEALSTLFHYTIEMVSRDGSIDLKSLLGKPLSVQIKQSFLDDQWINGDITAIEYKGMEKSSSRYYIYQAEIRPKLWYLTQNKDFRIFQEKNVPEIIKEILANFNVQLEDRLTQRYRAWGYCVQYNESAFNFISRLMEHEGIYYYFIHKEGEHKLVLADTIVAHEPLVQFDIPYRGPNASAIVDEIYINQWQIHNAIKPNFVSLNDYDFRKPYASMLTVKGNSESYSPERTEIYEWPGRFADMPHAQNYARIRKEEEAAQHEKMNGSATSCQFFPGYTFILSKAPRSQDNQEYLIVQSNYTLWDNSYASGEEASRGQRTDFTVIPSSVVWRTPRMTPWPKTQGPQTAQVICPPGETIWTDKYGRVKVKFHWDRYSKGDDNSSCWIRVASSWAGMGYGAVQIPRLYDEVLVDFINGDPDRPIIVGRVYNEANMPPWDLPDNATQMGIYSRSKNGHKGTANIFQFEDKLGQEQVYLQAEKDFEQLTKNNHHIQVNNNYSCHIINNSELRVNNEYHETVVKNRYQYQQAEEHHITNLDRKTHIKQNDYKFVDQAEHIAVGTIKSVKAGEEIHLKAGMDIVIDGGFNLTLKAGGHHITLSPAGIFSSMPINLGGIAKTGTPAVPVTPIAETAYKGILDLTDKEGKAVADVWYKIVTERGTILAEGMTDNEGKSIEVSSDESPNAILYLGKGEWTISEEDRHFHGDECGCSNDGNLS